jgi:protein SCO1
MSVDKNSGMANIDNEPIAGFMDPMVMPYSFKPPAQINQLQPGDSISADVVVDSGQYWLENVKVTGHSPPSADRPTSTLHIPAPGDDVPDFKLVNQKRQANLPASVSRPDSASHSHLHPLSLPRFLPARQPRVLRDRSTDPRRSRPLRQNPPAQHQLRSRSRHPQGSARLWLLLRLEARIPRSSRTGNFPRFPQAELPAFADYFALTYKEEGGLITHTLSTAVISPDGKIFKWYHGADWQASDLLQDIAAAAHPAA